MRKGILKLGLEDINIEINDGGTADTIEAASTVEEASKELDEIVEKDEAVQEVIENLIKVRNIINSMGITKDSLMLLNQNNQLNIAIGTLLPSFEEDGTCCDENGNPISEDSVDLTQIPKEEVIEAINNKIAAHTEDIALVASLATAYIVNAVIKAYKASSSLSLKIKAQLDELYDKAHGKIDEADFKAEKVNVLSYDKWSHGHKSIVTALNQISALKIEDVAAGKPFYFDVDTFRQALSVCGYGLQEKTDTGMFGLGGTKGKYYKIVNMQDSTFTKLKKAIFSKKPTLGEKGWNTHTIPTNFKEVYDGLELTSSNSKLGGKLKRIESAVKANKKVANPDMTKDESNKIWFETKESVKLYSKVLTILFTGLNELSSEFVSVCKAIQLTD